MADQRMLRNMLAIADSMPWWRYLFARAMAWRYYRAVRLLGGAAWTERVRPASLAEIRAEKA